MRFRELPLKGAFVIDIDPFEDHRGEFSRLYCKETMKDIGFTEEMVQVNYSKTITAFSIRGLHYQLPPAAEAKLIRCINGSIFDVIIDLRVDSPTFMQYYTMLLSKESQQTLYVPKGFAHGFQTLEPECELLYFVSASYQPSLERGIRFDDSAFNVPWPHPVSDISEKDTNFPFLDADFGGINI